MCPTARRSCALMAWNTGRRAALPPNWQRGIRPRILARDPICQRCHHAPSTEVHHLGDGNDHTDTNLQGICHTCHQHETQREAQAARAAQPKRQRHTEPHPGLR